MLRPDPEIDFLSFSLADAITASLGSLESLVVRSTLAASRFKGDGPDLSTLASELGVDAAVTGTLLRAGAQVRVATQLVEAQSGRLLWSHAAQVTLNDVFQLQDDLTRQIVESLSLPLSAREQRMLSHDAPASARSYEYYLRANELASDPKSWAIARDLYQQAVQEDPRYAPAWARLGGLHRLIAKLGGGTNDDVVRAESALRRALELNPELPLAHNLTAQMDIDAGRARDAMVRLLGQASRRSTDPELFTGLVYACRYCGLLGASLRADARARRLDPAVKTSVIHTLWMLGKCTTRCWQTRRAARLSQSFRSIAARKQGAARRDRRQVRRAVTRYVQLHTRPNSDARGEVLEVLGQAAQNTAIPARPINLPGAGAESAGRGERFCGLGGTCT